MINEIPEAKSLRWLATQFEYVDSPEDDIDRISNAIHVYVTAGADKIEKQAKLIEEQTKLLEEQAEKIGMLEIRANNLTRLNLL